MEKMMRIAALLPGLILSACASVSPQSNADAMRWYAAGDIDSVAAIFAEDAVQMPPNSPPLVGRAAIRQFWRQAVEWGKWEFTLQAVDVSVSGPMAVERGKYALKFSAGPAAPPGMNSFVDHGSYLVHWRHEPDGRWRAVSDAPVSEVPLASGMNPDREKEALLRLDREWAAVASEGKDVERMLGF